MAIDITILKGFDVIFVFLFVLVIVYAVLDKIKLFGDNKGLHGLVAFVAGILTLFSDVAIKTIVTAAPWFVLLLIFFIFILIAFMTFGVKEEGFLWVMKSDEFSYVRYWVIAFIIIIFLGSLSFAIAEEKGGFPGYKNVTMENATQALAGGPGAPVQASAFWETLFHPKILGMIAILMIALFTISRLTERVK